jgi:hypothetical protein
MQSSQLDRDFHVFAAVGTESHLAPLLSVGCALAAARGGRVTVISVTDSGQRPSWLTVPEL